MRDDILATIEILGLLHERGLLSAEELAAKKEEFLQPLLKRQHQRGLRRSPQVLSLISDHGETESQRANEDGRSDMHRMFNNAI
ncbi:MAG: hypothetical protein KTR25_18965 [Myxococcales bacterium]|nr:hypothetical protein [Myxococcales bacterium]